MKFPDVFEKKTLRPLAVLIFLWKENEIMTEENKDIIPDLTDVEEARKAFIAGEIFNRKY